MDANCPAININSGLLHSFDPYYVSAACTGGSVYHYDIRNPHDVLARLQHGPSIAPLDHKKEREVEDYSIGYSYWYAAGTLLYRTIDLTSRFHRVYDLLWHPLILWHAAATRSESRPSVGLTRGVQPATHITAQHPQVIRAVTDPGETFRSGIPEHLPNQSTWPPDCTVGTIWLGIQQPPVRG